jgi:hypothetical protein
LAVVLTQLRYFHDPSAFTLALSQRAKSVVFGQPRLSNRSLRNETIHQKTNEDAEEGNRNKRLGISDMG